MVLYIAVDDLAAYRKKVQAAGMGKFALFTDLEGRMMGLWKPKAK